MTRVAKGGLALTATRVQSIQKDLSSLYCVWSAHFYPASICFTGQYCTECEDELVASDMQCHTCVPKTLQIFIFMVAGTVCVSGAVFLVWNLRMNSAKADEAYDPRSICFKIIASSMQLNALALSFAFNWSDVAESVLAAQSEVSSRYACWLLSCGSLCLDVWCVVRSAVMCGVSYMATPDHEQP